MSLVALVDPATLLGQSMRDAFGSGQAEHEFRLLESTAEAEGTMTQIGSEVALVHALTPEALAGVDIVVLCGAPEQQRTALEMVEDDTPVILFATASGSPSGELAVAGISAAPQLEQRIVVSPHPGVVMLSHLLAPLAALGPRRVSATLLLPTSVHNEAGLDELFTQTRSILNFAGEMPTDIFPAQLAFNLLPGPAADVLGEQTAEIVGADLPVSIQLVQAPVFHSLTASVHVELDESAEADAVRDALASSSYLEIAAGAAALGPIDAAAREEILVGRIEATPESPGGFWLWAVMDNLTRGGANNAIELAEQLLAPGT